MIYLYNDAGTSFAAVTFGLPSTAAFGRSMNPKSMLFNGSSFPVGITKVTIEERDATDNCDG